MQWAIWVSSWSGYQNIRHLDDHQSQQHLIGHCCINVSRYVRITAITSSARTGLSKYTFIVWIVLLWCTFHFFLTLLCGLINWSTKEALFDNSRWYNCVLLMWIVPLSEQRWRLRALFRLSMAHVLKRVVQVHRVSSVLAEVHKVSYI